MLDALESIFGPGVGLIGFAVMLLILIPKFVRRWRGVQSLKRDPNNKRPKMLGLRGMQADPDREATDIPAHPDHGDAIAHLRANYPAILLESVLWLLPATAVYFGIHEGQQSLRLILFLVTVPIACIGVYRLACLWDRATFYRTGAILRYRLHKISLDYNSICEITERKPLLPWMPPSYILHLDDDRLLALDASVYAAPRSKLKSLLGSLNERVIRSAAEETRRIG